MKTVWVQAHEGSNPPASANAKTHPERVGFSYGARLFHENRAAVRSKKSARNNKQKRSRADMGE